MNLVQELNSKTGFSGMNVRDHKANMALMSILRDKSKLVFDSLKALFDFYLTELISVYF